MQMKIKYMLLCILCILFIQVASAIVCQDTTSIADIPCTVVTPVLFCTANATVTDLNTTSQFSIPMISSGDGTYSFQFGFGIDSYRILLCDNSVGTINVVSTGTASNNNKFYPTTTQFNTGNNINYAVQNFNISVLASQYPYVDINQTETVSAIIVNQTGAVNDLNVSIRITEPDGTNDTFNMPFSSGVYSIGFIFNSTGDYPFKVSANGTELNMTLTTGIFLVRRPFTITVRIFKKEDLQAYLNNAGFVTAEFHTSKLPPNQMLQSLFSPFAMPSNQPVFHGNYVDGTAKIKLYESNKTYDYKFQDGISFTSTYANPSVDKFFRNNIFLGSIANNGTSTTYHFILTTRERNFWRWALNWAIVIGFVLILATSAVLFFSFPAVPMIAIGFGIVFSVILISLRIAIFLFTGN